MARLFTPEELGVKTPPGGFRTGAWVPEAGGRQFWNGTFSEPGVIHPDSNQQGAGQRVSAEVNRQSSVAQGLQPNAIQQFVEQKTREQNIQRPQPIPQPAPIQQPIQPQQQLPAIPQPAIPDPNAPVEQPISVTGPGEIGAVNPAVPDLSALQQRLFKESGVTEQEDRLTQAEEDFLEARNAISDNPFLSAGVESQKLRKLRQKFEKETEPLRSRIATKKADTEMKLQLQLKQFDLNSDFAQQSMQQFGTLLASGALNNATGNDIANFTRSTGIPSSMIISAINTARRKDAPKPQIISYDDGFTQGFVMINPETGAILGRQTVASSKPTAAPTPKLIQFDDGTTQGFALIDPQTGAVISRQAIAGSKPRVGEKPAKAGSTEFKAEAQSSINQFVTQSVGRTGYLNSVNWKKAKDAFLGDALGSEKNFIEQFASRTNPTFSDESFQKSYGFPKIKREDITGEFSE